MRRSSAPSSVDRYPTGHLPALVLSGLKKVSKTIGIDLWARLASVKLFKHVLNQINAIRDRAISNHLREKMFTPANFALLRLVVNNSKREYGLINQTFKHEHRPDGTRRREKLCGDSALPAPDIFSITDIAALSSSRRYSTRISSCTSMPMAVGLTSQVSGTP